MIHTAVASDPLDVAELLSKGHDAGCGGIGAFVGTVRTSASTEERDDVVGLEYEAHPTLAEERLLEIANEAVTKWDLQRVVAVHRTGHCAVGDPTVVVVCSAPHRAAALDATRWVIDTVKETVPIWKKELFGDGSAWVGTGS
jgi:molybdopterin synthase catalytic subunit